jgi:hypothetical protein
MARMAYRAERGSVSDLRAFGMHHMVEDSKLFRSEAANIHYPFSLVFIVFSFPKFCAGAGFR